MPEHEGSAENKADNRDANIEGSFLEKFHAPRSTSTEGMCLQLNEVNEERHEKARDEPGEKAPAPFGVDALPNRR